MSKERLSRLQRTILEAIKDKKHPGTGKALGVWHYRDLCREVRRHLTNPLWHFHSRLYCPVQRSAIRSDHHLSQSVRNLEKKGFVNLNIAVGVGQKLIEYG